MPQKLHVAHDLSRFEPYEIQKGVERANGCLFPLIVELVRISGGILDGWVFVPFVYNRLTQPIRVGVIESFLNYIYLAYLVLRQSVQHSKELGFLKGI